MSKTGAKALITKERGEVIVMISSLLPDCFHGHGIFTNGDRNPNAGHRSIPTAFTVS